MIRICWSVSKRPIRLGENCPFGPGDELGYGHAAAPRQAVAVDDQRVVGHAQIAEIQGGAPALQDKADIKRRWKSGLSRSRRLL